MFERHSERSRNCVYIDITKSVILPFFNSDRIWPEFNLRMRPVRWSPAMLLLYPAQELTTGWTRIDANCEFPFPLECPHLQRGAYQFRIESVAFRYVAPLPRFSRFHETGAFACREGTHPKTKGDEAAAGRTRGTLSTGSNTRQSKREFLFTDGCSHSNIVPCIDRIQQNIFPLWGCPSHISRFYADLIANFSHYRFANEICRNDNIINTD